MTSAIPNLWPSINASEIKSPGWIIRVQASNLRESTNGLLEGEIEPIQSSTEVCLKFYIVAPQIDRYRVELFRIWHKPSMPYPVVLATEFWQELETIHPRILNAEPFPNGGFMASNQHDFLKLLESLFQLDSTKQVLDSLLALTNDREPVLSSDASS